MKIKVPQMRSFGNLPCFRIYGICRIQQQKRIVFDQKIDIKSF